jgi:hypothetical protein
MRSGVLDHARRERGVLNQGDTFADQLSPVRPPLITVASFSATTTHLGYRPWRMVTSNFAGTERSPFTLSIAGLGVVIFDEGREASSWHPQLTGLDSWDWSFGVGNPSCCSFFGAGRTLAIAVRKVLRRVLAGGQSFLGPASTGGSGNAHSTRCPSSKLKHILLESRVSQPRLELAKGAYAGGGVFSTIFACRR